MVHCKLPIDIEEHRKFAVHLYLFRITYMLHKDSPTFCAKSYTYDDKCSPLAKAYSNENFFQKLVHQLRSKKDLNFESTEEQERNMLYYTLRT